MEPLIKYNTFCTKCAPIQKIVHYHTNNNGDIVECTCHPCVCLARCKVSNCTRYALYNARKNCFSNACSTEHAKLLGIL